MEIDMQICKKKKISKMSVDSREWNEMQGEYKMDH